MRRRRGMGRRPHLSLVLIPAALSSLLFWRLARRRASSSCFSRAFLLAFLPCRWVQAQVQVQVQL